jgi:hypothetical protein
MTLSISQERFMQPWSTLTLEEKVASALHMISQGGPDAYRFRADIDELVGKVTTVHDRGPWPAHHDWRAVRPDWDEGMPIGHGRTEADAIADLIEQEDDSEPALPIEALRWADDGGACHAND